MSNLNQTNSSKNGSNEPKKNETNESKKNRQNSKKNDELSLGDLSFSNNDKELDNPRSIAKLIRGEKKETKQIIKEAYRKKDYNKISAFITDSINNLRENIEDKKSFELQQNGIKILEEMQAPSDIMTLHYALSLVTLFDICDDQPTLENIQFLEENKEEIFKKIKELKTKEVESPGNILLAVSTIYGELEHYSQCIDEIYLSASEYMSEIHHKFSSFFDKDEETPLRYLQNVAYTVMRGADDYEEMERMLMQDDLFPNNIADASKKLLTENINLGEILKGRDAILVGYNKLFDMVQQNPEDLTVVMSYIDVANTIASFYISRSQNDMASVYLNQEKEILKKDTIKKTLGQDFFHIHEKDVEKMDEEMVNLVGGFLQANLVNINNIEPSLIETIENSFVNLVVSWNPHVIPNTAYNVLTAKLGQLLEDGDYKETAQVYLRLLRKAILKENPPAIGEVTGYLELCLTYNETFSDNPYSRTSLKLLQQLKTNYEKLELFNTAEYFKTIILLADQYTFKNKNQKAIDILSTIKDGILKYKKTGLYVEYLKIAGEAYNGMGDIEKYEQAMEAIENVKETMKNELENI